MKKFLAATLSICMLLSASACQSAKPSPTPSATPSVAPSATPSPEPSASAPAVADQKKVGGVQSFTQPKYESRTPSGQLIIGSSTKANGDLLGGWGNNAVDYDIKTLIHGYATVSYTKGGTFEVNPMVVKTLEIVDNPDKTKTYILEINDNLKYSDGSAITAKDYVFDVLLSSSPQFGEIDGDTNAGNDYIGYEEFQSGKTRTFSGVRLLDDYKFSLTVKADKFPYFYEINFAGVGPLPMAVLAPGCDITDDGNGATFSDNFTTEVIAETISNTETGYRYKPLITSGPYKLESFDRATGEAVIVANPEFLGNYEGRKAQIERLILREVKSGVMKDEFIAGNVELLGGVGGGTSINALLDVVDQGKADYITYDRAGYGKITFMCDFGPTQFKAVRQAIAYALDRIDFAALYSKGYAQVVNGNYGMGMWAYQARKDEIENSLNPYTFDMTKAEEVLIEDGWTKNKDGGDYVKGTDTLRYKEVNGELMPLELQWGNSASPVTDLLNTMLPSQVEKIGMKIVGTSLDYPVMLNNMYRIGIEKPVYHMYNGAVGFALINDPWYQYNTDDNFMGQYNTNFIKDEKLMKLAQDMRETNFSDKEGYADKYVKYQQYWNEVLPDVPLYSDIYHDFFNPKLKNYEVGQHGSYWVWRFAILDAYVE